MRDKVPLSDRQGKKDETFICTEKRKPSVLFSPALLRALFVITMKKDKQLIHDDVN
ncbi:TPA: hypothetical protein R4B84_004528 [Salmonella enterica subsp. enterica serovar Stanley]|nr:hypothetical protein [Salmonella enterica]MBJ3181882.1 hypothetical protein [Salmonella enterica subsp. enterica serovar Stanley]EHI5874227.1 hypothetical protein [Salmonella enterica]EKO4894629.1 hypothetical protein [Salmonella enterica]HAK5463369.1 hypothetical protein [Salmonella enterica]